MSSPGPLRDRVHPLMRFAFSSEYVSAPNPPQTFPPSVPSVRFRSPSRHQLVESTCNEQFPSSSSSTLSVPPALDGLLLFKPCEPISSRSRVRFTFQGFSPPLSRYTSSVHRSLLPLARSAYRRVTSATPASSCPSYRALIQTAIRCRKPKCLASAASDPLLGF